MHDDLQMMRQLELEKCFGDGQIPCRWAPDMGYGFGFPLFNFYPPFPYFFGELFRLVGFSFVDTAKLTFAFSIILSGVFMYLFSKEFFGRIGGVLSAIFYIWAPYHAVDVYVRGAMNESWALTFFPLICWSAYKLITSKFQVPISKNQTNSKFKFPNLELKWILLLAFSYFGLFTSHNLMLLIFTPVFAIWVLILVWQRSAWLKIPSLFLGGIWSLGLAAFFTIPAIAENKFTQLQSQLIGYYDFSVHFVSIRQLLFSRFWGYGPSVWLEEDRMSFQIGELIWGLSLVVFVLVIARLFLLSKNKSVSIIKQIKNDKIVLHSLFFIGVGWFAAFMTHSRSVWFWTHIPQVSYLQFPWRFLALVIFAFSFAIGAMPGIIADFKSHHGWVAKLALTPVQIILAVILALSTLLYSWNYFLPEYGKMGALTDEQKFSGVAWDMQQTAGIYDYLPQTAKTAPKMAKTTLAEVVEGEGSILGSDQGTYWGTFTTNVETETALIRINIFDFPGMKVYMDGKEITHFIPEEEEWGRMYIVVPQGTHKIYTQLLNTPVRIWSNIVSFASWGLFIGIVLFRQPWKKKIASA